MCVCLCVCMFFSRGAGGGGGGGGGERKERKFSEHTGAAGDQIVTFLFCLLHIFSHIILTYL